jgi:hypothetical protein
LEPTSKKTWCTHVVVAIIATTDRITKIASNGNASIPEMKIRLSGTHCSDNAKVKLLFAQDCIVRRVGKKQQPDLIQE